MYMSERLQFAFVYKKPPIFDNSLNDHAYSILEKAPIFMMLFAYWQLGNRQMFFNEVEVKQNQRDIVRDGHKFFNFS